MSKARKVLEECRVATAPEHMDDPCVYELRMLIDQIELLENQVKEIDTRIEEFFSTFEENELYTSIDGVARVTAAAIHANFGPLTDFPHPDKAVAFAGLDPSIVESGKFKGSEHHISKRGSPYLRAALYQAANVAVRCNPVLRKVYRKKRKEGLCHKAAVCVAARKLVRIMHSIAVNRKPFFVPANISS